MRKLIASYRRTVGRYHHPVEEFEYVHAARKVVGVGSVGTRAWILLMVGRDEDDPLFLQAKEAQPSVLERFVGASEHANHGRRVVVGQRVMQAASDFFLGWVRVKDLDGTTRDYYIRQLHDWKGGVEVETFRVPGAMLYGRLCGATLARAHARWGDRLAIASYLGKGDAFDRATRGLLRRLRRSERARLRELRASGRVRPARRRDGPVEAAATGPGPTRDGSSRWTRCRTGRSR